MGTGTEGVPETETGTVTGGVMENAEQHYRCWGKLYGTTTPTTDDADNDDDDDDDDTDNAEGKGRDEDRYKGDRGDGDDDDGDGGQADGGRGRGSTAEVVLSGLESTGGSSYM